MNDKTGTSPAEELQNQFHRLPVGKKWGWLLKHKKIIRLVGHVERFNLEILLMNGGKTVPLSFKRWPGIEHFCLSCNRRGLTVRWTMATTIGAINFAEDKSKQAQSTV